MATRAKFQAIGNGLLSLVRGPFFLSALSVVLLAASVPAQATLLKCYLKQDTEAQTAGPDISEATLPATSSSNSLPTALAGAANSFPTAFEGAWRSLTVVIDSAVDTVDVGQRIESQVEFARSADRRIVAHWGQNGWSESAMSVTRVSDAEAAMDRTNLYMDNNWAARSRDRYVQVDDNRIVATSYVDQYADGVFVGRYKTKSVLLRVSGPQHIALSNQ